jgi:hypothetical protein
MLMAVNILGAAALLVLIVVAYTYVIKTVRLLTRAHLPRHNDDIAAWLRFMRNQQPANSIAWLVVDDLLDNYLIHAAGKFPLAHDIREP